MTRAIRDWRASKGPVFLSVLLDVGLRAALIIILGWGALELTGEPSGPAWVFLLQAAVASIGGPLIGVWVDRLPAGVALGAGALLTAAAASVLACLPPVSRAGLLAVMMLTAALVALGGLMTTPTLHRLLQARTRPDEVRSTASRNTAVIACAGLVGAGAGGVLVERAGVAKATLACVFAALAVAAVGASLTGGAAAQVGSGRADATPGRQVAFWPELASGVGYIVGNAELRAIALTMLLTFSVSNVSMALMPAFVRDVLVLDVADFGVLRAVWPLGALGSGLGLSWYFARRRAEVISVGYPLTLLGAATIAFAFSDGVFTAAACLLVSGAAFACCRALLDAAVLQACPPHLMGRTRNNLGSLMALSALTTFLFATAVEQRSLRSAFLLTGLSSGAAGLVGAWTAAGKRAAPRVGVE